MRGKYIIQGTFWILVYLFLVCAPLLLLLIGEKPEGRKFRRELSVALGFAGLAMLSLQFVLTARFKRIKAPYGADIVYHFHRQVSLVALMLILVHPLLLFIFSPATLRLLKSIHRSVESACRSDRRGAVIRFDQHFTMEEAI